YFGIEMDFSEQLSVLSYKKKINQERPQEEKEYNTILSKKRILAEHTISKLKKYKIMSNIFRNKLRKYNKVSDIVLGLIHYRISN
ncbi:MAG TPA: transposase family protein, partial [Candidatus Nitrosocosmicus sp.]